MFCVFEYWFQRYRRTWRGTVVVSVLNPLLFLIGIGVGLGHLVDRHAPAQMAGVHYAAFFAIGLLATAAMQTAFLESSMAVVRAVTAGAYRDTVPTPLEPEQVLAGHMLFVAFRVLSSSAAFVVVAAAFGLVAPTRVPGVLVAATLTGMAFATPAAAWSVGLRQLRHSQNALRMVVMPLYMFSGAFFALSQLPAPLRLLIEALPLAQGIALCRSLAFGATDLAGAAAHAAYLVALAGGGLLLARAAYRRRLHP